MAATLPIAKTRRTIYSASLRRIGIGLFALLLAVLAQSFVHSARPTDAVALFVVAIAIYLGAFSQADVPLAIGARPHLTNRPLVFAGVVACLAAATLAAAAAPHFITDNPSAWGWTLHLSSMGALLAGGVALDAGLRPPAAARATGWRIALGLLALTALATALRLPNLDGMPFGLWHDEAENALAARDILFRPAYRPFFLGSTSHTAHHNYLVALAFAWLGESIASARLVSAIMGVAMVPAGYLAAAELFNTVPAVGRSRSPVGPAMGLLFAALLAVSSWSLNFSRIAVNYIATPLFILLAVGLTLRAVRTQRMGAWLLGGASLGMGINFYSSFRLFLPVLPLFLLATLVARRALWTKSWRGLLLWGFAALIVMTPLLTFAATNQTLFLKRSADTFLLKDTAPDERLALLLENARTHLLMFNVEGDRNGRHNLPGRPMLDPYLGGLFAVGLAVCLWRLRRPGYLLLLLWLGFTLLGGVLTLSFEAPQSLRANGAMLAAYLIALVPVAELLRAWDASSGGRYYPRAAAGAAALLLLPAAWWHMDQYFVVQQKDFAVWNAFSTPETLTARTLATLDPETTQAYVVSYFDGRPPLTFIAPQWRGRYIPIEGSASMPLIWPGEKDVWLFLDADSDALYQQLQTMYPGGEFTVQTLPFAERVSTRTVHLSRAVLDSAQGLEARYYANAGWEGEPAHSASVPAIDADWSAAAPLAAPFSAEYEGVVRVVDYAPHTIRLVAPGHAELLIDEQVVLSGTGTLSTTVTPALGNHLLRVRAVGAPGTLQLRWATAGATESVVPPNVLFHAPVNANGLLGTYYANADWEPPVAHTEITPQLGIVYFRPPVPRPFSVEWTGKIAIPLAGDYLFSLSAIDAAQLWIDGQDLLFTGSGNMVSESYIRLTEGLHDIRVRYRAINNHNRIGLQWTPPGGVRQPVPSSALFPPMGSYARIVLPSAGSLTPMMLGAGDLLPAEAPAEAPRVGAVTTLLGGLNHPTGIALGPDGRGYVVDSGAKQLLVLAPAGTIERTITGGVAPFGEPFDVATDAEGTVYVLDAEVGEVILFNQDGEYMRTVKPADTAIARSRGLAVDAQGRIWVANTAGQRLLAFSTDGALLAEIPVWPDADAQVTDVAVAPDGSIYAVAIGINKLIQYDADGSRMGAWDVALANTIDAPHLALGGSGALYLTQPEEGRIVRHGNTNDVNLEGAIWQLPTTPAMVKPVGIAVASDGALWITDVQGGRIVRMEVEEP